MAVQAFTKTGTKATAAVKLDKAVFGIEVKNHQLLKEAYLSVLANSRSNPARTLRRGEVRGGGRKPFRQKGTGRARAGSTRSPLWRGGGITFGPTGNESHGFRLSTANRRQALRQALSLAEQEDRLIIIEDFAPIGGKTKAAKALLEKIGGQGSVLLILEDTKGQGKLAARNLSNVTIINAARLNVQAVIDADKLVLTAKALEAVQKRLGGSHE